MDWLTHPWTWTAIFIAGGVALLLIRRRIAAHVAWLDFIDWTDRERAVTEAIHTALHTKDASGTSAWERCFGREYGDLP